MPSNLHLLDYIQNSPLAQDLTERDCGFLESVMCIEHLEKGVVLIEEGQVDSKLFIIAAGHVEVTKLTGGENVVLHVLGPGSLAGEMGFVDNAPHSATLITEEPTTVLCLQREDFEKLVPDHPNMTYHVMRAIIRMGHSTLKRMNNQYVEMNNYITKTHGRY